MFSCLGRAQHLKPTERDQVLSLVTIRWFFKFLFCFLQPDVRIAECVLLAVSWHNLDGSLVSQIQTK